MKTRTSCKIPLTAAAIVLWLATSISFTRCNTLFDGVFGNTGIYFWLYAPLVLLFSHFRKQPPASDTPRWAQALVVYLCAALLFFALHRSIDLRYEVWAWALLLLLVFRAIVALSGRTFLLHPPQDCDAAYTVLLIYGSFLLALIGMLLVLHPVSVDAIIRTGQAAGGQSGEYVGRLTSDTDAHPLGTYVFADSDNNYYYYDVVSGAFIKKQSIFDHLADIYE